jgi:hypothetical protein
MAFSGVTELKSRARISVYPVSVFSCGNPTAVPIWRLPARSRRAGDGLAAEPGAVPGASYEEPPAQPAATATTGTIASAGDEPARVPRSLIPFPHL